MNNLSAILKNTRKNLNKTQAEMADLLGVKRVAYTHYETGRNNPKVEFLISLKDVLKIDLINNVTNEDNSNVTLEDDNNILNENRTPYILSRRIKKNEYKEFRVPLVTIKARAGYVSSYDSTDVINSLEKYAIPPGVTYTGAIWRYFEVDGDSMEPALVTGDYVLCSQVPQDDWENIRNFYVHVLVTDSDIIIKRIFVKDTGEWVLISDNETHKQKFFDVTTLKELWVFRRLIKKTISAMKTFKINI